MKTKLDELREMISNLFNAATDKATIEKVGAVSSKLDEIKAEDDKKDEDYKTLLNDYKDVVVHSSFKPTNKVDSGIPDAFDADKAFDEIFSGKK